MDLVVASQGEHSLVGAIAEGLHVDLRHPDRAAFRICAEAGRRPFRAVVASDDSTVELAATVAAQLGLPGNPVEAARLTRRKDLARRRLAEAGLPTPQFRCLDLRRRLAPQLDGLVYPCVVKPVSLSASRGVIRADESAQLLRACERIRPILTESEDRFERNHVLVESYLSGPEYALEGILKDGRLRVLAIFDKPDSLHGPFFEETYYITPSRLSGPVQESVHHRVQQACAAYGLRHGPVHAEFRIAQAEVWILEVAARTIGGQCARLLELGTGFGLEELVLAEAAGSPIRVNPPNEGAGVLMIPIPRAGILRRIEGVLEAAKVPYVEDIEISIREGYELVPLPEGARYLGFIFAHAPSAALAEAALRSAHGCLNIVTAPLFPLCCREQIGAGQETGLRY
jgi:biotin carboxylase